MIRPLYRLVEKEVADYVPEARRVYASDKSYKTSVIEKYTDSKSPRRDVPLPVKLTFRRIADRAVITEIGFRKHYFYTFENSDILEAYDLKTGYGYSYCAFGKDDVVGDGVFDVADLPRFIKMGNIENVRDIGGWNGLAQGRVYRGSRLNADGFLIDEEGKRVFRKQCGIQTELDLRGETELKGISSSPVGEDVRWLHRSMIAYTNLFEPKYKKAAHRAFAVFAVNKNYPIYMHCWGGADRTASVAFILQSLCGASEEDLAIDFELTSFAVVWGMRTRYDQAPEIGQNYASMVKILKKKFAGRTLAKKAENYLLWLWLSPRQIGKIRDNLTPKD